MPRTPDSFPGALEEFELRLLDPRFPDALDQYGVITYADGYLWGADGYERFNLRLHRPAPYGIIRVNPNRADAYDTITEALQYATSGDAVLLGPGTYHESVAVPAGVALIGAYNAGRAVIAGSGSSGVRVSLGSGSVLGALSVEFPSDTSPAVDFASFGIARIQNVNLKGTGSSSAIGVRNSSAFNGALLVERLRMTEGECDVLLTGSDSSAFILCSDLSIETGTAASGVRVSAGNSIVIDSFFTGATVNVEDALDVSNGTLLANTVNIQSAQNALHISGDGVQVEIREARLNADNYDVLIDPGLSGIDTRVDLSGCQLCENKITAAYPWLDNASYAFSFIRRSALERTSSQQFWADTHVGHAEHGRQFATGEGGHYNRGIAVLTTDDTAGSASDGGNFVNVTHEALTEDEFFSFQGSGDGYSILVGSTLTATDKIKYWGWRVAQEAAAVENTAKSFAVEIWNGSAWQEIDVFANSVEEFYRYSNSVFLRANSCEQIHFGPEALTDWQTKTIDGYDGYWSRIRIVDALATAPTFNRIDFTPSTHHINRSGYDFYTGRAEFRTTIQNGGNVFGESGGVADFSQSVGSGGAPTGWSHVVKNSGLKGNIDAIYFQFAIPRGTDTSHPFDFIVYYTASSRLATADMTLSVLPVEVHGVMVADPAGGIEPVPRALSDTETLTSKQAQYITKTLETGTNTKMLRAEYAGFDVSDYYDGDVLLITFTASDLGNNNFNVFMVEVRGVRWTHGEFA